MTVDEVINGEGELTPQVLQELTHEELVSVAIKLFEIDDAALQSYDDLLINCIGILKQETDNSNRDVVERFVRDLDNQEKAVSMALNIRNVFGRDWFEAEALAAAYRHHIQKNIEKNAKAEDKARLKKEFHDNPPTKESVIAELSTLSLFGLVKKQSFKGGTKVKYKIVMTLVTRALERRKKEKLEEEKVQILAKIENDKLTEEASAE